MKKENNINITGSKVVKPYGSAQRESWRKVGQLRSAAHLIFYLGTYASSNSISSAVVSTSALPQ